MTYDEARQVLAIARSTINASNYIVGDIAALCVGRLRQSNATNATLSELKRELKDYNIHTREWK